MRVMKEMMQGTSWSMQKSMYKERIMNALLEVEVLKAIETMFFNG